jgi:hypothetical protein
VAVAESATGPEFESRHGSENRHVPTRFEVQNSAMVGISSLGDSIWAPKLCIGRERGCCQGGQGENSKSSPAQV